MLLYDLLTLLKDTVILDLFSKMHKKRLSHWRPRNDSGVHTSYDIKIRKSQCYLEGTIILMSLLFRKLQYG